MPTALPFDWLSPARAAQTGRGLAMCRREVEERAALFFRLRYSADLARRRLKDNHEWDFEIGGPAPLGAGEIDAIVDAVYARRGATRTDNTPTL